MPYGYRPYGYRPGWSFNFYFGRPYRLPIYGNTGYGYYAIDAGFAYGSLQIVDAPPYAQVFVDGYYAGEVDEFDRVFQQLNLTPGPHHIEIVVDEAAPPIEFDVRIIPGETVTYRVSSSAAGRGRVSRRPVVSDAGGCARRAAGADDQNTTTISRMTMGRPNSIVARLRLS
jgi:hypothetical protein